MAKRRVNMLEDNEALSQETPKVQEALLDELVNQEEPVKQTETFENEENNSSDEVKNVIMDEPVDEVNTPVLQVKEMFKIGDRVKILPDVSNDMLGRRIHNGVKNYVYKIHNIRDDGYCTITCLTHCFTLKLSQLQKV